VTSPAGRLADDATTPLRGNGFPRDDGRRAVASAPRPARRAGVFVGLAAALVVAMTASVSWGQVGVPPLRVWQIVGWHVTGLGEPTWPPIHDDVVWQLRAPRVVLAALVGAGLTVVGIVVQALVRNPLADPYLLGVSQGASVGAVFAIVVGVGSTAAWSTSAAAFAGAIAAMALVYALARRSGAMAPLRLVLSGVAIGYGLHGVAHYLVLQADDPGETNTALFWLLGSLGGADWDTLLLPAVTLLGGIALLVGQARVLNALLVGDETAAGLGVDVERWRRALLLVASLVTGVMVAVSGSIGFVGLVVPHAMRMLVGGDHRRLLPAGVLGGAAFLVVADTAARMALSPREMPIGVITAVAGAPAFLALMHGHRLGGER
jgi:iron complex transport system permease protein